MPRLTRLHTIALLPSGVALWGLLGLLGADSLAGWVRPFILVVAGISALMTLSAFWSPLGGAVRWVWSSPWRALPLVLALWAIWGRGLWATRVDQLPAPGFYIPFSLLWVWAILAYCLAISDPRQHRIGGLVRIALQGTVSVTLMIVMLEVLLRLTALNLPSDLVKRSVFLRYDVENSSDAVMMPPQAPIRHYRWAGQTLNYTLYNTDGDLFHFTCLQPPSPKEALYEVTIPYNPQGFRQTTDGPTELIVVGDSFTVAAWTPEPYWMGLASQVLAMGITGSGSLEQAMLLEAFGPERQPKVVLMAYFEGNDLQDTWGFSNEVALYEDQSAQQPSIWQSYPEFRPLRFLSAYAAGLWLLDQFQAARTLPSGDCPYPMTDAAGNTMGYYDPYVSMATVEREALAQSELLARTTQAIRRAADQAEAMNAEFVLMFIPTTFHAHYPSLQAAGLLPQFAQFIPAFEIGRSGLTPQAGVSPDQVEARLERNVDAQRDVLGEWAAQEGILFLDLTPALQTLAQQGRTAYSPTDTHWSNEGHAEVRQLVRDFLEAHDLFLGEG